MHPQPGHEESEYSGTGEPEFRGYEEQEYTYVHADDETDPTLRLRQQGQPDAPYSYSPTPTESGEETEPTELTEPIELEPEPAEEVAPVASTYRYVDPDWDNIERRSFMRTSGRPEPVPLPGEWNVGRFLRRFAGADENLLAWVPQERPRYTGMGGAVLFTSLMAFVSMTIAISIAFHTTSVLIVLFSVLWFLLILNIDRWIVASPVPENRWQRVPTIVVRMSMAFVFGVVIAEPLVLTVFDTAVTQKVQEIRAEEKAAYTGKWLACNPPLTTAAAPAIPAAPQPSASAAPAAAASAPAESAPPASSAAGCDDFHLVLPDNVTAAESQLSQAKAQQQTNEATLAEITAAHEKLVKAANDDCTGVNGHYGKGPVCTDLRAAAAAYWRDHNGSKLEADVAAGRARVTELQASVTDLRDTWSADRSAAIDREVTEWAAGREEPGLLERIEALNLLALKHLSLALGIWAVRLLLILVDLAPALLKFTSGTTTYDRLVSANLALGEVRNRTYRRATEEDMEAWIDESNDERTIGLARRRAARDADVDALLDLTASRRREAGRGGPLGRSTYTMPDDAGAGTAPPQRRS